MFALTTGFNTIGSEPKGGIKICQAPISYLIAGHSRNSPHCKKPECLQVFFCFLFSAFLIPGEKSVAMIGVGFQTVLQSAYEIFQDNNPSY
jgi:hypothetical protein